MALFLVAFRFCRHRGTEQISPVRGAVGVLKQEFKPFEVINRRMSRIAWLGSPKWRWPIRKISLRASSTCPSATSFRHKMLIRGRLSHGGDSSKPVFDQIPAEPQAGHEGRGHPEFAILA